MMHTSKAPGTVFRAALLLSAALGIASLGVTRTAQAYPEYPPILAAAIAKKDPMAVKCVPQCTACHFTTEGGGSPNPFGENLVKNGLVPGLEETVEPAFNKLAEAMPAIDSDGDGSSDIAEIHDGNSPSIAYPNGQGQFCPDIKYGCGAHIAAAPSPHVDRIGLFSAGLVVFGFAAARRRKRRARA